LTKFNHSALLMILQGSSTDTCFMVKKDALRAL
jgi:hypothetical protein